MDAEKSLVARLDELARRCERSGRETYTRFLDPAQVEKAVWAAGRVTVSVTLCPSCCTVMTFSPSARFTSAPNTPFTPRPDASCPFTSTALSGDAVPIT